MFENNLINLFLMIIIPIMLYLMVSESELNKIKARFSGINIFKPMQYVFILFSISNISLIYYLYTDIWYKNIYLILFDLFILIFTILMGYFILVFCFLEKDKNITFINLISFSSLCLSQIIVQFSVTFNIYNKDELIKQFKEFNILFGDEKLFILWFFSFLFLMSLILLFETYFKYKIKVNFVAILFALRIILMSIIIALFIDNFKYEKSREESINLINQRLK